MKLKLSNAKESGLLFVGDILVFVLSLWLTLFFRHLGIPESENVVTHLIPFSLLFVVWVSIFFIAGLYDKHTTIFKKKLPSTILYTQIMNVVIAALFFFLVPIFGIAPKTNLVIYLLVSFTLVTLWRLVVFPWLTSLLGRRRSHAILIGSGKEIKELYEEVNGNNRYPFQFVMHVDTAVVSDPLDVQARVLELVSGGSISVIVGDSGSKEFETLVPLLSNLAFLEAHFHFIDVADMYENVFDRIPLSLIRHDWFLQNISGGSKRIYDFFKRVMDISAAMVLGAIFLLFLPLLISAIKLDDGGPIFYKTERVGRDNKPVHIVKLRSMSGMDKGSEVLKTRLVVTRVGRFLRKTRLDEFPQLWNVLRGDISLIGPRLELPAMVKQYAERILHYNVRHVIKPGLTGWAQIYHHDHPHHSVDFEETSRKLSYDLYYIKNRSLILDIIIALKTAKILVSLAGK